MSQKSLSTLKAMKKKKPKLLVIGHGDAPMGYARVVHSLLPFWHSRFECHQFVFNKTSITGNYPWAVYPNDAKFDPHGFETIKKLVVTLEPQIIWLIHNFHNIPLFDQKLRQWSPRSKLVTYFPIEGDLIQPAELSAIINTDLAVTYLSKGVDLVKNYAIEQGTTDNSLKHLRAINHGVDRQSFFPLVLTPDGKPDLSASQQKARQELFGPNADLKDAWLVFNGNRNQRGKAIPATLEGFKLFAEKKPQNVKLYLNMGAVDRYSDLTNLIRHYDLKQRVVVSRKQGLKGAFTTKELNLLYNACQVGVNTSLAEGWGLVSFEHAATGRPQIVPRHSACQVLWQDTATLLTPPPGPSCYPRASANTAINPVDLAEALEKHYSDETYYQEMAMRAYTYVCEAQFSWCNIAELWLKNFEKLIDSKSVIPSL